MESNLFFFYFTSSVVSRGPGLAGKTWSDNTSTICGLINPGMSFVSPPFPKAYEIATTSPFSEFVDSPTTSSTLFLVNYLFHLLNPLVSFIASFAIKLHIPIINIVKNNVFLFITRL